MSRESMLSVLQDRLIHTESKGKFYIGIFGGGSVIAVLGAWVLYSWRCGELKFPTVFSIFQKGAGLSLQEKDGENLLDAKRVKRGFPPGLVNTGNSCFANCLLQALSSLEGSNEWIIEMASHMDSQNFTVLPSLSKLIQALSNKKYLWCESCTTSDLIDSLQAHGWVIPGDQQDAHEFYQVLMSTIDEEIERHQSFLDIPALSSKFPVKFEHFDSISLRIPRISMGVVTLESCISDYVRNEKVDDVCCPGCEGKRSSFSKKLFLAKVPKCLCLQIQRTYYENTGRSYKNPTHVRFPEILDVFPFSYSNAICHKGPTLLQSATQHKGLPSLKGGNIDQGMNSVDLLERQSQTKGLYALKALVVHHGEVYDGHFIAYRRNLKKSKNDWIYISDTHVRKALITDVLSSVAYLLFYERI